MLTGMNYRGVQDVHVYDQAKEEDFVEDQERSDSLNSSYVGPTI